MELKNIFKNDEGQYIKVFTVTEEKQELMTEEELIQAKDKFKAICEEIAEQEDIIISAEEKLEELKARKEILNVFQHEEEVEEDSQE